MGSGCDRSKSRLAHVTYSSPCVMLRPDTFALTAVLALLTTVGPLSVDMYLPSLPDIGRELAAALRACS